MRLGWCVPALFLASLPALSLGPETSKWKQRVRDDQVGIQLSAEHVFDSATNTLDDVRVDGRPWSSVLIVACSNTPKGLYAGLATTGTSQPADGFPGYAAVLIEYDRRKDHLFLIARDMGKAVVLQGPQNDKAVDGLNWHMPETLPADKSLSADDHRFLDRLGNSELVQFFWTPKDGKMLIFDFDVRGFREAFKPVQRACQR